MFRRIAPWKRTRHDRDAERRTMSSGTGVPPCRHRLLPQEESHCWLESSRLDGDGTLVLIFRSHGGRRPLRCGTTMASVCPWRSWDEAPKAAMVPCPHCGRRHRDGSTSQQLCEAWSSSKAALKMMRETRREGERFYPEGTRELPYPDHTSDVVRRLIWKRMKSAVLRRDRYRCQQCGAVFGKRRRQVFDPTLRRGRGGNRWESLEVHHIIPRSKGGSDHPGNLMTLCPSCHLEHTAAQASERVAVRRDDERFLRALDEDYVSEWFFDPRD